MRCIVQEEGCCNTRSARSVAAVGAAMAGTSQKRAAEGLAQDDAAREGKYLLDLAVVFLQDRPEKRILKNLLRRRPVLRPHLQHAPNKLGNFGRIAILRVGRLVLAVQNTEHERGQRAAIKCVAQRHQLVQHTTQRPDVTSVSVRLILTELGR